MKNQKSERQEKPDSLVNKWFHSIVIVDGKREIQYQGQIIGKIDDNHYLIQLYNWTEGAPTYQKIEKIDQMYEWVFYETDKDMRLYRFIIDKTCVK